MDCGDCRFSRGDFPLYGMGFLRLQQKLYWSWFLAVDFFFCLSGFVIGYAYDNRIRKMGVGEFFKSRLIRLHPLVVLGSVLGLFGFLLDPFASPVAYSAGKLLLLFVCSVLLLPFPVMEDRAFNLFGLNAPSWSLFWEYVANIFYAFVF